MRTALLNDFAGLRSEFREHLAAVWELSEDQRERLVPAVVALLAAETSLDRKKVLEEAVASVGAPASTGLRALNVLAHIVDKWNPLYERVEDCLEDIDTLELVPPEQGEQGRQFFEKLFRESEAQAANQIRRIYAGSVVPTYLGCSSVVDARAAFVPPFGSDGTTDVDAYAPSWHSWIPVAVVKVLASGDQELVFQCDSGDLDLLIDQLSATRKEMRAVEKQLSIQEER